MFIQGYQRDQRLNRVNQIGEERLFNFTSESRSLHFLDGFKYFLITWYWRNTDPDVVLILAALVAFLSWAIAVVVPGESIHVRAACCFEHDLLTGLRWARSCPQAWWLNKENDLIRFIAIWSTNNPFFLQFFFHELNVKILNLGVQSYRSS